MIWFYSPLFWLQLPLVTCSDPRHELTLSEPGGEHIANSWEALLIFLFNLPVSLLSLDLPLALLSQVSKSMKRSSTVTRHVRLLKVSP